MIRKHIMLAGRVQGVGFRWYCQVEAHQLGLTGYAQNLPDGRVECEIEGLPEAIDTMLSRLAEGPRFAQVSQMRVIDIPVKGSRRFTVH